MVIRGRHIIDLYKILCLPYCLCLLFIYEQRDNVTMWIYTALHGSYGLTWCIKSLVFPDKNFEFPMSTGMILFSIVSLSIYWITPYLIASRGIDTSAVNLCIGVFFHTIGVFFVYVSDMQKTIMLERKPELITDRMFALCRNPNYFGEFMIYLAFTVLTGCAWPALLITVWQFFLFMSSISNKEKSLARYEKWESYANKTNKFVPNPKVLLEMRSIQNKLQHEAEKASSKND